MKAKIQIQIPNKHRNQSFFLENQTAENLKEDILILTQTVNPFISCLSVQKDRVLYLNAIIRQALYVFKEETNNFLTHKLLDNVKYFIRISNRSIDNFGIEVHLLIDDEFTIINI